MARNIQSVFKSESTQYLEERKRRYPSLANVQKQLDLAEKLAKKIADDKIFRKQKEYPLKSSNQEKYIQQMQSIFDLDKPEKIQTISSENQILGFVQNTLNLQQQQSQLQSNNIIQNEQFQKSLNNHNFNYQQIQNPSDLQFQLQQINKKQVRDPNRVRGSLRGKCRGKGRRQGKKELQPTNNPFNRLKSKSLISKLIEKEEKQERSALLQCLRFIAINHFFEGDWNTHIEGIELGTSWHLTEKSLKQESESSNNDDDSQNSDSQSIESSSTDSNCQNQEFNVKDYQQSDKDVQINKLQDEINALDTIMLYGSEDDDNEGHCT